jgi:hypothetical protein
VELGAGNWELELVFFLRSYPSAVELFKSLDGPSRGRGDCAAIEVCLWFFWIEFGTVRYN